MCVDLANAIVSLRKSENATAFLKDLLTNKEYQRVNLRWQVAKGIARNTEISNIDVAKSFGCSQQFVAEVRRHMIDTDQHASGVAFKIAEKQSRAGGQ